MIVDIEVLITGNVGIQFLLKDLMDYTEIARFEEVDFWIFEEIFRDKIQTLFSTLEKFKEILGK